MERVRVAIKLISNPAPYSSIVIRTNDIHDAIKQEWQKVEMAD